MVTLLALFGVLAVDSIAAVVALSRHTDAQALSPAGAATERTAHPQAAFDRVVHDARSVHAASILGDQYHR
jgi:hypothetical protein